MWLIGPIGPIAIKNNAALILIQNAPRDTRRIGRVCGGESLACNSSGAECLGRKPGRFHLESTVVRCALARCESGESVAATATTDRRSSKQISLAESRYDLPAITPATSSARIYIGDQHHGRSDHQSADA